ncbi:MAG: hypothetical protein WD990_00850 [Acidimicrobiia bacterium]
MAEGIELRNKVVAIFDTEDATTAAVEDLRTNGYTVEVLEGDEGRERLKTDEEHEGFFESLRGAFESALGDEGQILDNVDAELMEGAAFVVVEASSDNESEIAEALKEHGGHYLWHFDSWSYVSLGGGGEM